jgi:hypothetical protein
VDGAPLAASLPPASAPAPPARPPPVYPPSPLCSATDTINATHIAVVARLTGQNIIPFTRRQQRIIVQAILDAIVPAQGPVQLRTYREAYPDPRSPGYGPTSLPYIDLASSIYRLPSGTVGAGPTSDNPNWQEFWASEFASLLNWAARITELNVDVIPRVISINIVKGPYRVRPVLAPMVNTEVLLALDLGIGFDIQNSTDVSAAQATGLQDELWMELQGWAATHMETASTDHDTLLRGLEIDQKETLLPSERLALVEVTVAVCDIDSDIDQDNECELGRLEEALRRTLEPGLQLPPGITGVRVVFVRSRVPPRPPTANEDRPWVPWWLDRLDQAGLPLDNVASANATGSGVNIYLISSVRGCCRLVALLACGS